MSETLNGSCLCKRVCFQVLNRFNMFHQCHCSRCRKASGTAHVAALYTDKENLVWFEGGDLIKRFDLPEARWFCKSFCSHCGSPVPVLSRDKLTYVVPAGSLDDEPDMRPQDHIFWQSRAGWYEEGLRAVKFDEYPTW